MCDCSRYHGIAYDQHTHSVNGALTRGRSFHLRFHLRLQRSPRFLALSVSRFLFVHPVLQRHVAKSGFVSIYCCSERRRTCSPVCCLQATHLFAGCVAIYNYLFVKCTWLLRSAGHRDCAILFALEAIWRFFSGRFVIFRVQGRSFGSSLYSGRLL